MSLVFHARSFKLFKSSYYQIDMVYNMFFQRILVYRLSYYNIIIGILAVRIHGNCDHKCIVKDRKIVEIREINLSSGFHV